jgi:phosphocarrier protein
MASDSIQKDCPVRNKMGIHARPAAQIVAMANKFPCDVTLVKDGQEVNGKSIMGVLMLAAAMGTTVVVKTDGDQAQQCADAIADLFAKGFNEGVG